MDYREYIKKHLIKNTDRILEFGPLIRPLVSKKDYPGIKFADVRSTEDIRKLYTSNDYLQATGLTVDINSVAEIDYVVSDSYSKIFKNEKKFDVVYLSHVIEHMPDIISFFNDVKSILKKESKLILIYPDARYCFDHFRNGSTFVDAYDVYRDRSRSSNRVLDFVYNVVGENNPLFFWSSNKQGDILPKNDFKKSLKAYEKALCNELPDDTHFWPFSDYQFVKFLYDMDRAGLLDFSIKNFYPTQENQQEFMIVLTPKTKKEIDYTNYKKILNKTNPIIKQNKLMKEIKDLKTKNNDLTLELNAIHNSKKWQYVKKIALIRNKIIFK